MFARNLFDTHYIQNLTIRAGHSGLILGTPGDLRIIEARSACGVEIRSTHRQFVRRLLRTNRLRKKALALMWHC
jgi:hypothetical protein